MSKFVLTAQLQLQAPKNTGQVVNQLRSQLGKGVSIDVDAKGTAKAQRDISKLRSETDKASKSADRMGNAFRLSIRRFAGLAIATRAVSLFTSGLGGAVKEAISFERELIKISQVTGKSTSQLRGLTDTITNLSREFGVASSSLLGISRILSQAGFDAKQTEVALSTLARTELAPTFEDITRTAEGAVAIFNQFGKGAGALEAQLGSINAVAGKFAVEAGDLIATIRRTGGVFKSAGGDLNELVALFTSVRSTTRESAEGIATGLRTIFTRIQRPRTIQYLRQFGVELQDLEGKFVGPFNAVEQLSKALSGLEQGDLTFVQIAEELGGFRQIGKVIPLIQQNRVAQEALNVAQAGGNSLAIDAAKAQQTLAVRIGQVREDFIALVRSISETTSFQLFANTALALAEALVKVGEALKPILPLMAAFAGFKLASSFGGLAGGALGGGRPRGFATGGVVPGTGNRDTVPAMLTPGEFVINKKSTSSIGTSNLAHMNAGGVVTPDRSMYGANRKWQDVQKKYPQLSEIQSRKVVNGTATIDKYKRDGVLPKTDKEKKRGGLDGEIKTLTGAIGGFFLRPAKGQESDSGINRNITITKDRKNLPAGDYKLTGDVDGFFTGRTDINTSKPFRNVVEKQTKTGLKDMVLAASKQIRAEKLVDIPPIDGNEKIFERSMSNLFTEGGALESIEGYMLEGIISALTGAALAGGKASFDFPSLNPTVKTRLANVFRSKSDIAKLVKADAKRTANTGNFQSIKDKLVNDLMKGETEGTSIKLFAAGGAATGTDTVPAMLTPGEFVVNKSSAQRIGYGNLGRMNKVGKYADGGIVQHFNEGSTGPVKAKGGIGVAGALGGGVFAAASALASIIPPAKELESTFVTVGRVLSNSVISTSATIGAIGFTLNQFGEGLDIKQLMQGKFTGPLVAGGAAATLVSSALMGLEDSAKKYNRAIKEGNVEEGQRQAVLQQTSAVRSGASQGIGALASLAATAIPGGMVAKLIAAPIISGLTTALVDSVGRELAEPLQDILSVFGGETVEQTKAIVASKIAANNLAASLGIAGERAEAAFKEGLASGNLGGAQSDLAQQTGFVKDFREAAKSLSKTAKANVESSITSVMGVGGGTAFSGMGFGGPGMVGMGGLSVDSKMVKGQNEQQQKTRQVLLDFITTGEGFTENLDNNRKVLQNFIDSQGLKNLGGFSTKVSASEFEPSLGVAKEIRKSQNKLVTDQRKFLNEAAASAAFRGEGIRGPDDSAISLIKTQLSLLEKQALRSGDKGVSSQRSLLEKELADSQSKYNLALKDAYFAQLDSNVAAGDLDASFVELLKTFNTSAILDLGQGAINARKELELLREQFALLNNGLGVVAANSAAVGVTLKNLAERNPLQRANNVLEAATSGANVPLSDFNAALEISQNELRRYGASQKDATRIIDTLRVTAAASQTPNKFFGSLDSKSKDDLSSSGPRQALERIGLKIEEQFENGTKNQKRVAQTISNAIKDLSGGLSEAQQKDFRRGNTNVLQEPVNQKISEFKNRALKESKQQAENLTALNALFRNAINAQNDYVSAVEKANNKQIEVSDRLSKFGIGVVTIKDRLSSLQRILDASSRTPVGATPQGINARTNELVSSARGLDLSSDFQEARNSFAQVEKELQKQVSFAEKIVSITQKEFELATKRFDLENKAFDSLASGNIEDFFVQNNAQGALESILGGQGNLAGAFGTEALRALQQSLQQDTTGERGGRQIRGQGGLLQEVSRVLGENLGLRDDILERFVQSSSQTSSEQLTAAQRLSQAGDTLVKASDALAAVANQRATVLQSFADAGQTSQNIGGDFSLSRLARELNASLETSTERLAKATENFGNIFDKIPTEITHTINGQALNFNVNAGSLSSLPAIIRGNVFDMMVEFLGQVTFNPDGSFNTSNIADKAAGNTYFVP